MSKWIGYSEFGSEDDMLDVLDVEGDVWLVVGFVSIATPRVGGKVEFCRLNSSEWIVRRGR